MLFAFQTNIQGIAKIITNNKKLKLILWILPKTWNNILVVNIENRAVMNK